MLDRLGREYDEAGKAATFEALRGVFAGDAEASYAAVAARLGTTKGAARIDDEIRDLFTALGT